MNHHFMAGWLGAVGYLAAVLPGFAASAADGVRFPGGRQGRMLVM